MHGFETCLIRIKDNKQPHTKFDKAAQNERTVYIEPLLSIFFMYTSLILYINIVNPKLILKYASQE